MKNYSKILVAGSSNTDMVIMADHFPSPGETILGGRFLMNPGGKGANQAVAAARLGGKVAFLSKIGKDVFGEETMVHLKKEGIDTSGIAVDDQQPSGVAQIIVDKNAENCIVVAPGANMTLSPKDADRHLHLLENAEVLLMQLEIPIETIVHLAKKANGLGKKAILNPAPAQELPNELYSCLYAITPNETETTFLTGIKVTGETAAGQAADFFHQKGVNIVIITMGAEGAYVSSPEFEGILPAPSVKAMDTTAAGDTFNGALAAALSNGKDLKASVEFANTAAAMAVTKMGAQSSIPTLQELS